MHAEGATFFSAIKAALDKLKDKTERSLKHCFYERHKVFHHTIRRNRISRCMSYVNKKYYEIILQ